MKAFRTADLRVNLWLLLVNAVSFLLCIHEICYVALFAVACLWLVLRGKYTKALKFMAAYGLLYGASLLTMGIRSMTTLWFLSNIARHLLITVSYADGLSDAPTGTFLSVFQKLHLPKAAGISTAVLLRFLPTISYEFGMIRNSLKFRNVGVGFWSTVTHLPSNFELTIVPLLIRTTRIAEELSAAAMVRGVEMSNDIVSIDEIAFGTKDAIISVVWSLAAVAIVVIDRICVF